MTYRTWEFIRPTKIINQTTGQWIPVDLEIHRDDIDWLIKLLNATWLLDWKLDIAEQETKHS